MRSKTFSDFIQQYNCKVTFNIYKAFFQYVLFCMLATYEHQYQEVPSRNRAAICRTSNKFAKKSRIAILSKIHISTRNTFNIFHRKLAIESMTIWHSSNNNKYFLSAVPERSFVKLSSASIRRPKSVVVCWREKIESLEWESAIKLVFKTGNNGTGA